MTKNPHLDGDGALNEGDEVTGGLGGTNTEGTSLHAGVGLEARLKKNKRRGKGEKGERNWKNEELRRNRPRFGWYGSNLAKNSI